MALILSLFLWCDTQKAPAYRGGLTSVKQGHRGARSPGFADVNNACCCSATRGRLTASARRGSRQPSTPANPEVSPLRKPFLQRWGVHADLVRGWFKACLEYPGERKTNALWTHRMCLHKMNRLVLVAIYSFSGRSH